MLLTRTESTLERSRYVHSAPPVMTGAHDRVTGHDRLSMRHGKTSGLSPVSHPLSPPVRSPLSSPVGRQGEMTGPCDRPFEEVPFRSDWSAAHPSPWGVTSADSATHGRAAGDAEGPNALLPRGPEHRSIAAAFGPRVIGLAIVRAEHARDPHPAHAGDRALAFLSACGLDVPRCSLAALDAQRCTGDANASHVPSSREHGRSAQARDPSSRRALVSSRDQATLTAWRSDALESLAFARDCRGTTTHHPTLVAALATPRPVAASDIEPAHGVSLIANARPSATSSDDAPTTWRSHAAVAEHGSFPGTTPWPARRASRCFVIRPRRTDAWAMGGGGRLEARPARRRARASQTTQQKKNGHRCTP